MQVFNKYACNYSPARASSHNFSINYKTKSRTIIGLLIKKNCIKEIEEKQTSSSPLIELLYTFE